MILCKVPVLLTLNDGEIMSLVSKIMIVFPVLTSFK